jgi:hypothetical protein
MVYFVALGLSYQLLLGDFPPMRGEGQIDFRAYRDKKYAGLGVRAWAY